MSEKKTAKYEHFGNNHFYKNLRKKERKTFMSTFVA